MEIPTLRPRLFKRTPLAIIVALALGSVVPAAHSLGFGRAQTTAVLGSPLDFRVGLRLDDGETLDSSCVSSTVLVGESLVPQSAISILLDGAGANASLRVATSVPMTEPLVVVSVSAGCTVRVTRRFTLFADPPGHRVMPVVAPPPPPAPVPAAPAEPATQTALAFTPPSAPLAPPTVLPLAPPAGNGSAGNGSASSPAPASSDPGQAPARAQTPPAEERGKPEAPAPVPPPAPAAPAAPAVPTPAPAPTAGPAPSPRPAAKPATPSGATAARPPSAAPQARAPAAPVSSPRLKLEAPRISSRVIDAAAAAEREAALRNAEEAAISAKAAAEAAERRASDLERSIALLQAESKANREALLRLTQALEQSRDPDWSQALLAALVALLGLTAFLLYRLRRLQIEAREGWVRVSPDGGPLTSDPSLEETPGGSAAASEHGASRVAPGMPAGGSATSVAALASLASVAPVAPLVSAEPVPEADAPVDRTRLLPPTTASVAPPIRTVSIEELLDLEQQVEFYTVLGQDDAAVGLLVEHLRHTGGTYPLPFLKLMELYRRKGDADAYERTRDRFNQRFNAVAPAWGASAQADRGLDEYPEVMRQIQQAWSRPVDASALLENMLFRTQGGELFDLAALADVLFLFTLARDLVGEEGGEAGSVDVLLPFDEVGGSESDRVPLMEVPSYPSSAGSAPSSAGAFGSVRPPSTQTLRPQSVLPAKSPALSQVSGGAMKGSAAVEGSLDHIDIPLGEPMLEPLFQEGGASSTEARIDVALPTLSAADANGGGEGTARDPGLDLDLEFGDDSQEGAPDTRAASSAQPGRALDFDLSDFDLPVATVTPAAARAPAEATPAANDFQIDGLTLEPVPPRQVPEGGEAGKG